MTMLLKQSRWRKIAAVLLMIGLILSFNSFLAPETVSAAENPVTIKVNGEVCTVFTSEELKELQKEEYYTYSTINTWPTKSWYMGEGPTLANLLVDLEMPGGLQLGDIQLIKFKARDGLQLTFTKKELLEDTRYYFPGLKENHEYFGYIPGFPEEAIEVPTVLALLSIDSDDPADLEGKDRNAPHLIFGQRWITEQTNHAFVKTVSEIDLLTTAPEKWGSPEATPEPGIVSPGTKVRLSCQFNDADKVYYTIDGSDPTPKSPIYNWIASRWWNNRKDELDEINKPIEINEDTVIKAVTMGNGKLDSDITTFEYKIETVAVTGVSIFEGDQTLEEGGTVQLNAVVEPENAKNKGITWSTSDATVAIVDEETGLVTAVSEGEAIITVTTEDGNFIDNITVTIARPAYNGVPVKYNVVPVKDDAYTIGETADGIKIMTVNDNQTGLKYFTVSIESIEPHKGTETVIFTHIRGGVQLKLNALEADFDEVIAAKAGFIVKPGDVIKVYIVDELTNDSDQNPVMLQ